MFTLQQIQDTHAKVKSGADFPRYIQDMKTLGVTSYTLSVSDGHTTYSGGEDVNISSEIRWPIKAIAAPASPEKLTHDLKIHQLGKTDFLTFCQQAADAGVDKWTVDIAKMKCSYYDSDGNIMVAEDIPLPA